MRPARRAGAARRWFCTVFALALLIAAAHGRAVRQGLLLDDYAHYAQLREADWTLRALVDACRLELVGGSVELWWLPDCTLRFFRPVAFGLMKLEYELLEWRPSAMHVVSLGWHLAACALLAALLRQLGASAWLAFLGAALFATHPGHVATAQWIASQSELIVTTLLLASTCCYARYRAWSAASTAAALLGAERRGGWALASLLLFALALGCRENAIMLPFVLAPVEWLRRHRPGGFPVAVFFGYGCVAVAYLLVRWHYLSGAALPPPPYVVPPSDPGFARFVLDKTCYYLLGEFLLAPIVPIAGVDFLRSHPIPFYVSAAVVGLWVALIAGARIRRPDGAFGLLALLGFMAPVLPVFESPHHLYLPGVGWAVLVTSALGAGRRKKAGEGACGPVASDLRVRRQVEDLSHKAGEGACGPQKAGEGACGPFASFGAVLAIVLFATLSFEFGWTLEVAARVQDELVDEIVNAPQPVQDGQTLYVANLPMVAHYARLAIELQTATTGVRVVALTWAPRLLAVSSPTELRIVDERVIELRIREDRYFGGVIGRLVREATGQTAAELARGLLTPDFTVEALEHDEGGVSALRFTFHQNLRESQARLFWGSQTRWALPVAP